MLDAPELGDFDIMQEIASGRRATVYLVNCKRGRLRNRQLALRKVVSPNPIEIERLSESSTLHLSLSHPCILSLFSTFSTPSAHFQLLELALGGPLSTYIDGKTLSEDRLRHIVKGVAEALLYLKNEGIVHRNIQPANVLLTVDGRPKLSDFALSTYTPPSKISLEYFVQSPHFAAPEILSGLPHSYESDWWSLGCIILACLSGRPPFQAPSLDDTSAKILRGSYDLPTNTSTEARQLLSGLLETNPKRRTPLNEIISHPFFTGPAVPFLFPAPNLSDDLLSKHALFESKSRPFSVTPPRLRLNRHSYAPNQTNVDDLRNTEKRTALRHQLLSRRIVSDPLPRQNRPSSYPILSRTSRNAHTQEDSINISITSPLKTATSHPILPVGTTRPVPFTTDSLTPESHKTAHGNVTILPSRSLLVDFREAERRRGQKGTEVLLIDSQGLKVEVYAAPHLSVPCCLAEPIKQFKTDELSSLYWRQYNDAALLVERIKQRTPKLILHLGSAQCTLMANSAPADIELVAGPQPPTRKPTVNIDKHSDAPRIRLRLSRQQGFLEIAKHVSGTQGEEWTKRVFKTVKDDSSHICSADWESLDEEETNAMEQLNRFWRLCVFLEEQERQVKGTSQSPPRLRPQSSLQSLKEVQLTPKSHINRSPPRAASISSTPTLPLSNVHVPPRPTKFPILPARRPSSFNRVSFASNMTSVEPQHPSAAGKTAFLPTWCKDDDMPPSPMSQTKYIPSVGWCIRQSSRVRQGGRYKVMFVDGAVLEIDVDEDWAEFTGQDGATKRYNIRAGNIIMRPIAERMKVFGKFVSMFEDQASSPQRKINVLR
ncbi:kinase-like domain-containing protein [Mycena amicta]|nr:kinase-like domain-containing protein [Mycena amicta]